MYILFILDITLLSVILQFNEFFVFSFKKKQLISNQAKEFGRKSIVASDEVKDDLFSTSLVEFMKMCERHGTVN